MVDSRLVTIGGGKLPGFALVAKFFLINLLERSTVSLTERLKNAENFVFVRTVLQAEQRRAF